MAPNFSFQLFNAKTGNKLAESWGAPIVYDGEDFEDQFWSVTDRRGEFFKLKNKQTRKWLADSEGSLVVFDGYHCDDQYWKLIPYPDGYFKIVNKMSGRRVAESSHGQACVFSGRHHLDQLWQARPDIVQYGKDLGQPSSHKVEPAHLLDESIFPSFEPLFVACQDYASCSGCRFDGSLFNRANTISSTQSASDVHAQVPVASGYVHAQVPVASNSQFQRLDGRPAGDGRTPLEAAVSKALPFVEDFAERLRAGERNLVEALYSAVAIESSESIRSAMLGVFKALEMFPPEPPPEGVGEEQCDFCDESASLPVLAQRLYNDEAQRLRSKVEGTPNMTEKQARTASFLVEFAGESGVDVPETPADLQELWESFNKRSSEAMRRSRQSRAGRTRPEAFSASGLRLGRVAERLRADAGKWWDSDVAWAVGIAAVGLGAGALAMGADAGRDPLREQDARQGN